MRFSFPLFLLLLAFQTLHGQVTIEKEPSWVVKESYDPNATAPESGVNGGTQILLYTEQINVDAEEFYLKSATKAVEYSGIQNISNVVADYDPTYQKLRFHSIEVIRNGKSINKLRYQDIQTARRETNAENFIYDGTISAFVNVPDVRIGDIVLYSYSIKGFNPIHKGKFSTSFVLNSTQPIDKLSVHIFGKKKLNYQVLNSNLEAEHQLKGKVHHYKWAHENVPAILLEEQMPSWHVPNAMVIVSEYDNWSEVIRWGKEVFKFEEPLNSDLQSIVSRIKTENSKEGERIKAALSFVQNEVRYLAIHSGIGGYKPNSPNKVIMQRFGDCKDKSVLFVALLNNMGIEAYPTLVNTSLRQVLPSLSPSSKLFDHCIVKVIDQDKTTLWYDPTLTDQGGTYANTYTPDYRYGLVLDEKLVTLDTIADFRSNMVETFSTFKLDEMGKGGELEVRTHYFEGEADYIRAIFRNNSKDVIEQELTRFYAETYGKVSAIEPATFVDDTVRNEFALLERYQLDSIWRPSLENTGNINLSIYPTNLTSVLVMPSQLERSAPFALSYPMVRKQNVKIILPERIQARAESKTINSDFFYYDFSSEYDRRSNVLSLNYYYKNQDDHVSAEGFDEFYRDMQQLDHLLGYTLITNKNKKFSSNNLAFNLGKIFGYGISALLLIGLIGGVVFLVLRKRKLQAK